MFKVSLNGTYLTQFDNQLEKGGEWASKHWSLRFGQQRYNQQFAYHYLPLETYLSFEPDEG